MDDKVYTPTVIEDQTFPNEYTSVDTVTSGSSSGGNFSAQTTEERPFPIKRIAVELLSSSLNTRSRKILSEFEFTKQGAIQIGEYTSGVSGDIRISPNGFVARNRSGVTTIAIDGDTGDASFAGTVQAGTLISGKVALGDDSIDIDGAERRMVFYDDNGIPVIIIGNG